MVQGIDLSEFCPSPALVCKTTPVLQPKFPVFDAHNHLNVDFGGGWDQRPASELLAELDEAGVQTLVDLDGGWGENVLHAHLDHFKAFAPERFIIYGGVDWSAWPEKGSAFGEWAAGRLRAQAARGAQGLKIWKNLGLHVQDERGERVHINDPRLAPIWETAAELHLPITIHIADPAAFFDPLTPANERFEELNANPGWHYPSPPYPSFLSLVNDMAALVSRHPRTTFIGAHVGCYAENLAWVSALLDRCPNFFIDLSERIGELGRQPYSARKFFLKYADRILFGLDRPVNRDVYRIYYRFLETDDEYFNYGPEPTPRQGRWQIYGLYLPDDVLEKIYFRNAQRIILGQTKS